MKRRRPSSNNHFTEMCCGTDAGSYLRLIDSCITQLKAQGPSMTCNESKEEDMAADLAMRSKHSSKGSSMSDCVIRSMSAGRGCFKVGFRG